MFVETLDSESRAAAFKSFFQMTRTALTDVFGVSDKKARRLIESLQLKFSEAPKREQDLLLHNDPLALACELAEVSWAKINSERLEAFNRLRRQSFPDRL